MMKWDPLLSASWDVPQYVTVHAVQAPSASALISLAYDQQWRVLISKLNRFAGYQSNWDGFGSQVPDRGIFAIVNSLLERAKAASAAVPSTAAISPSGAIQLEWWRGDKVLQAEISDRNTIDWVEFGPNVTPRHWSVPVAIGKSARGGTWRVDAESEEHGAVSASQT